MGSTGNFQKPGINRSIDLYSLSVWLTSLPHVAEEKAGPAGFQVTFQRLHSRNPGHRAVSPILHPLLPLSRSVIRGLKSEQTSYHHGHLLSKVYSNLCFSLKQNYVIRCINQRFYLLVCFVSFSPLIVISYLTVNLLQINYLRKIVLSL